MQTVILYILRHWCGEMGLIWSFWVNLVALRLALTALQWLIAPPSGADPILTLPLAFLAHVIVFVWQVVGTLRAAEADIKGGGAMAPVWGAQLGCLIAFWLVLSDVWGAWQSAQPTPPPDDFVQRQQAARAASYSMTLRDANTTLAFQGTIAGGSTKAFKAQLEAMPSITLVTLSSEGGSIYEARGLAKVIREAGIATRVDDSCTSACVLAFIGGATRSLGRDGQLGFHQYRVDASYDVPFAKLHFEQERDRTLFEEAGVSKDFTQIMFKARAEDMWFPTRDELTAANVLK